jgi:oxygen-independent coproporphyrinogen-3 oxidase
MISAICAEIRLRAHELPQEALQSVYFGGGTPSLLTADELEQIMGTVHSVFQIDEGAELTLEANPDDISPESLNTWQKYGVNRLSIGLQSFRDEDLRWMNRAHNRSEALQAVELAKKAGFERLSVDLIYGLPGLSNEEWKEHMLRVIEMDVDHISAYCLTVEKKTVLSKWVDEGKIVAASEDQQSEQFMLLLEFLAANGFEQYEISNFARNGRYAVHNTAYWQGKPYLGIGPSAHSFDGKKRRWNVSNNTVYMKISGQETGWFEEEELTSRDRWNELLLTGLRTKFGVKLTDLSAIEPIRKVFTEKLNQFIESELLFVKHETLILTPKGRLQADHIASELFI